MCSPKRLRIARAVLAFSTIQCEIWLACRMASCGMVAVSGTGLLVPKSSGAGTSHSVPLGVLCIGCVVDGSGERDACSAQEFGGCNEGQANERSGVCIVNGLKQGDAQAF